MAIVANDCYGNNYYPYVARFAADGHRDTTYGIGGVLALDKVPGLDAQEWGVLGAQPDGQLLGAVRRPGVDFGHSHFELVRLRDTSVATPAGGFVPLAPARVLDTRNGTGAPTGAVAAGGVVDLAITGHGGVPGSGVSAVVLNVTVTEPRADGYVTV